MSDKKSNKNSMTVFKSDRHEDVAAICLAGIAVLSLLIYMMFFASSVTVLASTSGLITDVKVEANTHLNKGDVMYVVETTDIVWKDDVKEEVKSLKEIKAVTSGDVLEVMAETGQKISRHKTPIIKFAHKTGTLP